MRVLVTGGAGFIGSHYVRTLLQGGYSGFDPSEVVVIDKFTYAGNRRNLEEVADDPRLRVVAGDVCDADLVGKEAAGTGLIVHFAAESHVDRSIERAGAFVESNVVGTHTLLEAALAAGVPRFVQVSTDEVYGSIGEGSWPEEQPLAPSSPYAASKAAADLMVRAFHTTHGLNASISRCSNNYGPYQHPEKAVPLFTTRLLDGGPVPLYGTGRNVRDWLHVDDHCRALQLIAERGRPGEVYNVGGGAELTNRELIDRLRAITGGDGSAVHHVPDRKGHDFRYSVDTGKIARELGFSPRVGIGDGLRATVGWYRENRSWWEPLAAG